MTIFNNLNSKGSLLIIEDNETTQAVLLKMIMVLGYEVDVANNGAQALEILDKNNFDIVITDREMPILDGFGTARKIRSSAGNNQNIPIILITGRPIENFHEKCLEAGISDFLAKPFSLEDLEKILDFWMSNKSSGNEVGVLREKTFAKTELTTLEIERIEKIGGRTKEGISKFIEIYLQDMAQNLELLKKSVEELSAKNIAFYAHNCAGASGMCGFNTLVSQLDELEELGLENKLGNAKKLYSLIHTEFLNIKEILDLKYK